MFLYYLYGDHLDRHGLTHSFPTPRTAELVRSGGPHETETGSVRTRQIKVAFISFGLRAATPRSDPYRLGPWNFAAILASILRTLYGEYFLSMRRFVGIFAARSAVNMPESIHHRYDCPAFCWRTRRLTGPLKREMV